MADHAMVLMVTNLYGSWRLPICYFLITDKFSGLQQAQLVNQAIEKTKDVGAIVMNIVCDNPRVNYSMLKALGAQLSLELKMR